MESSLDICPAFFSPPSGHYVHPVAVARDLVLLTRNLPIPVSFRVNGLTLIFNWSNVLFCQNDILYMCLFHMYILSCFSYPCRNRWQANSHGKLMFPTYTPYIDLLSYNLTRHCTHFVQIFGFTYECELEYSNGSVLKLPAVFIAHSDEPLYCRPTVNLVWLTCNSDWTHAIA